MSWVNEVTCEVFNRCSGFSDNWVSEGNVRRNSPQSKGLCYAEIDAPLLM